MPETFPSLVQNAESDIPGGPMPEWKLFETKIVSDRVAGFTDPEGSYFPLSEGESLSHIKSDDGTRKTFIVSSEGVTPFEEWTPKVNIDRLRQTGEAGQRFAELYRFALMDDPRLGQVDISVSGSEKDIRLKHTGGFAAHRSRTASGKYELVVNAEDGWAHFENLLQTRRTSAEISLEKAGIDPSKADGKVLGEYIFLHELGHIVDYMDNAPDKATQEARRRRDMESLPVPGCSPVRLSMILEDTKGHAWFEGHTKYFQTMGVKSPEQLLVLQEKKYREVETEDNPDQFAAKILRRAYPGKSERH